MATRTIMLLSFQVPLMEKGDIIIDGGNSEYQDTNVSENVISAVVTLV